MRRVSARMGNEIGREPTEVELGEELGIATEKLARLRSIGLRPESLDAPVGDDEATELGEKVPDEQAKTPFESLREKNFSDKINRVLKNLNKRNERIIADRSGQNGRTENRLEQFAEI